MWYQQKNILQNMYYIQVKLYLSHFLGCAAEKHKKIRSSGNKYVAQVP